MLRYAGKQSSSITDEAVTHFLFCKGIKTKDLEFEVLFTMSVLLHEKSKLLFFTFFSQTYLHGFENYFLISVEYSVEPYYF